ncbi:hypothetical protein [Alteriqipengyuania sp.]|uniref:hypothetical protein n=1 Tax=Alteriqipengyuania sp. TaxID=2800692 RepID=UPI003517721C
MASAALHDTANFLRWRLVPVRKLGKVKNQLVGRAAPPRRATSFDPDRLAQLHAVGCCPALPVDQGLVAQIQDMYMPRAEKVVPTTRGHPFTNVMPPEDYHADNPVFRLAFSDDILNAAEAYFDGKFSFASIQVIRSFPTEGKLRESQKWHRDYGDSQSLHFILYLNDVLDDDGGPFAYIDREKSKKVNRSPVIRRLTDDEIAAETGDDHYERFYGKAGEAILTDPAVCYHFGSRCKTPRTAVFVTFNTHVPYTEMMQPLGSHRKRAAEQARKVRPDLPGEYIDSILQV